MTEDLRYTKEELQLADSVILHQREIIGLKDQELDLRAQELHDNLKRSREKQIRVGIISGTAGVVLGVVLGILL